MIPLEVFDVEYLWMFWIVSGIVFIVAEIFTSGFILLWFGIGAILAAIVAALGLGGLPLQVAVFLISSIILTGVSRTIFSSIFQAGTSSTKLGFNNLPGQKAIVTTSSHGNNREIEVKVYGSIWRAFPIEEDESFKEGQEVEIISVDGNNLYVRSLEQSISLISQRLIEK